MSWLLQPVDAGRVIGETAHFVFYGIQSVKSFSGHEKKWVESRRVNYYRYLIAAANVRHELRSLFLVRNKQVH